MYSSIIEMFNSPSLNQRVTACAAQELNGNPQTWAQQNFYKLCARTDWITAWESAKAAQTLDHNPDTGARPGVITDTMILEGVQAIVTP